MATPQIQTFLDQCRCFLKEIKEENTVQKSIVDALEERLNLLSGQCADAQWNKATDGQKEELQKQFAALLDTLRELASDGPSNPASEMHKTYASNGRIFGIGLWSILGGIAMIVLIMRQCAALEDFGMPKAVAQALPLIAVMGALGGFLSCIQSFGRYVGNRQLLRSWTIYYLLFPLKGAGLAIVVFFLIQTDLGQSQLNLRGEALAPMAARTNGTATAGSVTQSVGKTDATSKADQSTNPLTTATAPTPTNAGLQTIRVEIAADPQIAKKPNLVLACLVAALTGLFANQAIELLASIFSMVFKRVEGRDPVRDSGAAGPTSGKPPTNP